MATRLKATWYAGLVNQRKDTMVRARLEVLSREGAGASVFALRENEVRKAYEKEGGNKNNNVALLPRPPFPHGHHHHLPPVATGNPTPIRLARGDPPNPQRGPAKGRSDDV